MSKITIVKYKYFQKEFLVLRRIIPIYTNVVVIDHECAKQSLTVLAGESPD